MLLDRQCSMMSETGKLLNDLLFLSLVTISLWLVSMTTNFTTMCLNQYRNRLLWSSLIMWDQFFLLFFYNALLNPGVKELTS